jgi:hypothetical protein
MRVCQGGASIHQRQVVLRAACAGKHPVCVLASCVQVHIEVHQLHVIRILGGGHEHREHESECRGHEHGHGC